MESLFKVLFLVILDCNDCNSFHISDSFSHRYVFFWFLTGISQEDYRAAVRAGADIVWFCPSCSRPDADPVAESTRITESETDILESEEFNPPLPSSDSDFFESTVYEPPAQPALDESTIDDPTPNPVEAETEPLTFQFLEGGSERGKRKLIDNRGYSYNVKRQRVNATDWQCTVQPMVRSISLNKN